MIEIQTGLLKEDNTFLVNGKEHYNSRLYAKDGYHFYDVQEYEEQLKYIEEEKQKRLANGESIEDLVAEKNYTTFAITPLTSNDDINAKFKNEKI